MFGAINIRYSRRPAGGVYVFGAIPLVDWLRTNSYSGLKIVRLAISCRRTKGSTARTVEVRIAATFTSTNINSIIARTHLTIPRCT
jgi:hypothetical protein